MDESHSHSHKKWQIPVPLRQAGSKRQHTLKTEEEILQAISARAPVPEILNEICCALDCQIGNVVSIISTFAGRTTGRVEIGRSAARFGLHVFSYANIFSGSGEELGSLEVYCVVPRNPSASELRLMKTAGHMAALAIERETRANCRPNYRFSENGPTPGYGFEGSGSIN